MTAEERPDLAPPPYSESMTAPRAHGCFRRAVFASAGTYGKAVLVSFLVNLLALSSPLFALMMFNQVDQFSFSDSTRRLAVGAVVILPFDFVLQMLRG